MDVLEDVRRLTQEMAWLVEIMDAITEHDAVLDMLDRETAGLAWECVVWRCRQRLKDGYWDDAAYDRWLCGEEGGEDGIE